jgi:protein-S-isoprenylcysteine O-methyltransferase Ste14
MDRELVGWLNFGVLLLSSLAFSVLYVLSVRPAHLEQKIGEKAYRRCAHYRMLSSILMVVTMVNYVLYRWYPLPVDPLPARFPWSYVFNVVGAALIGVPAGALFFRGVRDAGTETMRPDRAHEMYEGIYQIIRHPQAVGEAPLWLVIALLLNSPFLTLFSLLYLPIWYWWCLEEEQDLLLRYGQAYADYRARTGMFFPRRRRRGEA